VSEETEECKVKEREGGGREGGGREVGMRGRGEGTERDQGVK
jgi:hypothetical protein